MADATVTQLRWKPTVTFATRLRVLRLQYGERTGRKVSQREMAKLVGIPAPRWSQWEAGGSTPRNLMPTVKLIVAATGVDAAWLLGVDQELPNPEPDGGSPLTIW